MFDDFIDWWKGWRIPFTDEKDPHQKRKRYGKPNNSQKPKNYFHKKKVRRKMARLSRQINRITA